VRASGKVVEENRERLAEAEATKAKLEARSPSGWEGGRPDP
jgi:hypothetical protein